MEESLKPKYRVRIWPFPWFTVSNFWGRVVLAMGARQIPDAISLEVAEVAGRLAQAHFDETGHWPSFDARCLECRKEV